MPQRIETPVFCYPCPSGVTREGESCESILRVAMSCEVCLAPKQSRERAAHRHTDLLLLAATAAVLALVVTRARAQARALDSGFAPRCTLLPRQRRNGMRAT
jgi:hypothetical protein